MDSCKRIIVLASLLIVGINAGAETISVPLIDDAYINANRPGQNYGSEPRITVHDYGPKEGLIRFNASALSGAIVQEATLTLYVNSLAMPGNIDLYAITAGWNEGLVTWNSAPPVEPAILASTAITSEGTAVSVDVTSTVQRWADGTLADGGFVIATIQAIKARFDTKETSGGSPASLVVVTDNGGPTDGEAIVLDLSNADNCRIDAPGYYALDRTWLLTPDNGQEPNANCNSVHIASSRVTLDMRGFAIRRGNFGGNYEPVLWIDTDGQVTVQDGELEGIFVAMEASVAANHNMLTLDRIRADGAVLLGNRGVNVIGGSFGGSSNETTLDVGEGSRVTDAALSCDPETCLSARGSSLIDNNTFVANNNFGPAIAILGDDTVIAGNVLTGWVAISGNRNKIARNYSRGSGSYIEVRGVGNILEGNIGPGIEFDSQGNFFGNNRIALPGEITGATGNVDWGGNQTY